MKEKAKAVMTQQKEKVRNSFSAVFPSNSAVFPSKEEKVRKNTTRFDKTGPISRPMFKK